MMTLPEDLLVDPLQGARHREHPEDEEDQAGGGRGIKRGRRGGEQVIHDGYLRAPGRVEGNPWTSRALRPCPPSRHENAYWRARADAVAMTTDSPLEGAPLFARTSPSAPSSLTGTRSGRRPDAHYGFLGLDMTNALIG